MRPSSARNRRGTPDRCSKKIGAGATPSNIQIPGSPGLGRSSGRPPHNALPLKSRTPAMPCAMRTKVAKCLSPFSGPLDDPLETCALGVAGGAAYGGLNVARKLLCHTSQNYPRRNWRDLRGPRVARQFINNWSGGRPSSTFCAKVGCLRGGVSANPTWPLRHSFQVLDNIRADFDRNQPMSGNNWPLASLRVTCTGRRCLRVGRNR